MEKQIEFLTSLLSGVLARSFGPGRGAEAKDAAQSSVPSQSVPANARVKEEKVDSSEVPAAVQESQGGGGSAGPQSFGILAAALARQEEVRQSQEAAPMVDDSPEAWPLELPVKLEGLQANGSHLNGRGGRVVVDDIAMKGKVAVMLGAGLFGGSQLVRVSPARLVRVPEAAAMEAMGAAKLLEAVRSHNAKTRPVRPGKAVVQSGIVSV